MILMQFFREFVLFSSLYQTINGVIVKIIFLLIYNENNSYWQAFCECVCEKTQDLKQGRNPQWNKNHWRKGILVSKSKLKIKHKAALLMFFFIILMCQITMWQQCVSFNESLTEINLHNTWIYSSSGFCGALLWVFVFIKRALKTCQLSAQHKTADKVTTSHLAANKLDFLRSRRKPKTEQTKRRVKMLTRSMTPNQTYCSVTAGCVNKLLFTNKFALCSQIVSASHKRPKKLLRLHHHQYS